MVYRNGVHVNPLNPLAMGDINQQLQADLVDIASLKQYNDCNTFLLTVIDVFSKKARSVLLKNKSGSSITATFCRLLMENDDPQSLQTDHGKEFLNREFQKFLKRTRYPTFHTKKGPRLVSSKVSIIIIITTVL